MHASAPSQIRFLSDLNEREHAKKDQNGQEKTSLDKIPVLSQIEHECLQFAQIITILSHQHTTVDLIENNDTWKMFL